MWQSVSLQQASEPAGHWGSHRHVREAVFLDVVLTTFLLWGRLFIERHIELASSLSLLPCCSQLGRGAPVRLQEGLGESLWPSEAVGEHASHRFLHHTVGFWVKQTAHSPSVSFLRSRCCVLALTPGVWEVKTTRERL